MNHKNNNYIIKVVLLIFTISALMKNGYATTEEKTKTDSSLIKLKQNLIDAKYVENFNLNDLKKERFLIGEKIFEQIEEANQKSELFKIEAVYPFLTLSTQKNRDYLKEILQDKALLKFKNYGDDSIDESEITEVISNGEYAVLLQNNINGYSFKSIAIANEDGIIWNNVYSSLNKQVELCDELEKLIKEQDITFEDGIGGCKTLKANIKIQKNNAPEGIQTLDLKICWDCEGNFLKTASPLNHDCKNCRGDLDVIGWGEKRILLIYDNHTIASGGGFTISIRDNELGGDYYPSETTGQASHCEWSIVSGQVYCTTDPIPPPPSPTPLTIPTPTPTQAFTCKQGCSDLKSDCSSLNIDVANNAITFSNLSISNTGNNAEPCQIGYYLSTTNYLNDNSILLGTQNIPELPEGGTIVTTPKIFSTIHVPSNNYYVIAVADYLNVNLDANLEDNECFASEILAVGEDTQPLPPSTSSGDIDLVFNSCGSITENDNGYSIFYKLQNKGSETIPATQLGVYLSSDKIIDQDDTLIKESPIQSLGPDYSIHAPISFNFNNIVLPQGDAYIILKLDKGNIASETNEDNNTCYQKLPATCSDRIQNGTETAADCGGSCPPCEVNLVSTTCATPIIHGDVIVIAYRITNTGNVNSGPFFTGWFLKEVGSTDILPFASLARHSGIDAGASVDLQVDFDLPSEMEFSNFPAGIYELYMRIDINNEVEESNKTDNLCTNLSTINYSKACDTNSNVEGTHNGSFNYTAPNYIEASLSANPFIASQGSVVTLQAGDYVRLKPGFHAKYGSNFSAVIDDCNDASVPKIAGSSEAPTLRNFPNPFSGKTTIEFELPNDSKATLFVTDMMGKKVATLLDNEAQAKGYHTVNFDGNNYPPGMYYYTLQAGDYIETQKMILMK